MATDKKSAALARADFIRDRIETVVEFWETVIEAYQFQDWKTLSYESWQEYLDGEFGDERVRLPKEKRQQIVAEMRQRGMSTRAIGTALGVDPKTARRDIRASAANAAGDVTGTNPVTSLDGRQRPATQPTKAATGAFAPVEQTGTNPVTSLDGRQRPATQPTKSSTKGPSTQPTRQPQPNNSGHQQKSGCPLIPASKLINQIGVWLDDLAKYSPEEISDTQRKRLRKMLRKHIDIHEQENR